MYLSDENIRGKSFRNIKNSLIHTERTILLRDLKFCWIQIWK